MRSVLLFGDPIVDWGAMWKICAVALAAGAGVVLAFGFVLLGLKLAQGPATGGTADGTTDGTAAARPSAATRLAGFSMSLVFGLICAGVIAIGVYAMTQKS